MVDFILLKERKNCEPKELNSDLKPHSPLIHSHDFSDELFELLNPLSFCMFYENKSSPAGA